MAVERPTAGGGLVQEGVLSGVGILQLAAGARHTWSNNNGRDHIAPDDLIACGHVPADFFEGKEVLCTVRDPFERLVCEVNQRAALAPAPATRRQWGPRFGAALAGRKAGQKTTPGGSKYITPAEFAARRPMSPAGPLLTGVVPQ